MVAFYRLYAVSLLVVSITFYLEKQSDYSRIDNDLKYRYTKMKGEVTPIQIGELENILSLTVTTPRLSRCVMMWRHTRTLFRSKQALLNKLA